jgi:hypothetical protein
MTGPPIVAYGNREGRIAAKEDDIINSEFELRQAAAREQEYKIGKLTSCDKDDIVNIHVAMAVADSEPDSELRFLKRHATISGIVTSETALVMQVFNVTFII